VLNGRNKVIVRVLGGLGNQLFCYAAARRLALVNNVDLVIDDVSGFVRDFQYNRQYQLDHFCIPCRTSTAFERMEPFSLVRRYLKRTWNDRLSYSKRSYLHQKGIVFDERLLDVKIKGTFYIEGYWQSEEYFKDVEYTLRKDLQIIPPTDYANLDYAKQIQNCRAVAVHFRFFDDPHSNSIYNAQCDYYTRAIEAMESIEPAAHYFIFSDQPQAVRARIPLSDSRVTLVAHNKGDEKAYADLWLMTHCQHFIIANSTFSWWGAWLSGFKGKHVIAPGFEILQGKAAWGFNGLLPNEWIKI